MADDNTRLEPDDYIPQLQYAGIADHLDSLVAYTPTIRDLQWEIKKFCIDRGLAFINLTGPQVERLIADLHGAGFMSSRIYGGSSAQATPRAAVTGTKISEKDISVDAPNGETYALRFYVNGTKKSSKTNENKATKDELGVKAGDTIQICQVVDGVVGWMTSAAVP